MACKGTWVCFDCRLSQRHPTWRHAAVVYPESIGSTGNVYCTNCHNECINLGPAIEIPAKHDHKGWRLLQIEVFKHHSSALQELQLRKVRSRHDLEQRIRQLETRPRSEGLDLLIKELKDQLSKL